MQVRICKVLDKGKMLSVLYFCHAIFITKTEKFPNKDRETSREASTRNRTKK